MRVTIVELIGLLSAAALLASCPGPDFPVRIDKSSGIASRSVSEKNYRLGQKQSAYVGQPVIRVRAYRLLVASDRMCLTQDATFKAHALLRSVDYPGRRGQCFPVIGRTLVQGQPFVVVNAIDWEHALLVAEDGSLNPRWLNWSYGEGSYNPNPKLSVELVPSSARFIPGASVERVDPATTNYLNYELIYGGTDGKSFTLTYREYTREDIARTAFFQNLVYDRGSEKIRFRETEIIVHEATNESLIYTVQSDGLPH